MYAILSRAGSAWLATVGRHHSAWLYSYATDQINQADLQVACR